MEPDINAADEGYSSPNNTSYATSIASNIRRGVTEYGRQFAAYGRHTYGLPIDEDEMARNDLQHCKFLIMYEGRLHLCPLREEDVRKILDLGTGNATWAIEMADRLPAAEVLGVDIAAVQPNWVPPNCQFEILDVEEEWLLKKDYDLIHAREFLFAIRDWPALISQAYDHLKPGGYLELACTVAFADCDDDSVPADSSYKEMSGIFFEMNTAMGVDGWAPKYWKQQLLDHGYDDVHERVFKIPTNPWPKDKRLKDVGALELMNFLEYSTAGFEKGYVGVLGRDPVYLQVLLAQTRKEVKDRKRHSYVLL